MLRTSCGPDCWLGQGLARGDVKPMVRAVRRGAGGDIVAVEIDAAQQPPRCQDQQQVSQSNREIVKHCEYSSAPPPVPPPFPGTQGPSAGEGSTSFEASLNSDRLTRR